MASIGQTIQGINEDKKDIKGQDDLIGGAFPVFKLFNESLPIETQATIIQTRNIGGETGIYGNSTFGIYGVSKYGSSATQSFILGSSLAGILGVTPLGSNLSAYSTVRVVCPDNLFKERFIGDDFNDSDETTANWNTTSNLLEFDADELAQSESIELNNGTITSATLSVTEESGSFDYYLTSDGTNWEQVTNGIPYNFTNQGQNLKFKIAENASSTGEISYIQVQINH